jgi:hypothetical protein
MTYGLYLNNAIAEHKITLQQLPRAGQSLSVQKLQYVLPNSLPPGTVAATSPRYPGALEAGAAQLEGHRAAASRVTQSPNLKSQ